MDVASCHTFLQIGGKHAVRGSNNQTGVAKPEDTWLVRGSDREQFAWYTCQMLL